jgi:hypothetical protein
MRRLTAVWWIGVVVVLAVAAWLLRFSLQP